MSTREAEAGHNNRCLACSAALPVSPEHVPIAEGPAQGTWLVWRCAACGASRARKLQEGEEARARIVALAQQYRVWGDRSNAEAMAVEHSEGDLSVMEDSGHAMDEARSALFGALDELEQVEGEDGRGR